MCGILLGFRPSTGTVCSANLVVGQLGVEWFWFVCDDSLKISG
jgi:hypothetical protein